MDYKKYSKKEFLKIKHSKGDQNYARNQTL